MTVSVLPSCILEKVTLNKKYLEHDEDHDVGKRGRRRRRRGSAAFAGSRFAGVEMNTSMLVYCLTCGLFRNSTRPPSVVLHGLS